jgi:acetyl esterase/lipase
MDLSKVKVTPLLPRFERVDTVYKTVNGTPISTAILIPKTLVHESALKACPLLVHFHGGGLYMGTNPEPYFLSNWYSSNNTFP